MMPVFRDLTENELNRSSKYINETSNSHLTNSAEKHIEFLKLKLKKQRLIRQIMN